MRFGRARALTINVAGWSERFDSGMQTSARMGAAFELCGQEGERCVSVWLAVCEGLRATGGVHVSSQRSSFARGRQVVPLGSTMILTGLL